MVDLFEEVEEQLRSDRYKQLAFKSLPWVLGLLLAAAIAALAVWGWREHHARQTAKASEEYALALTEFEAGQVDKADRRWGEVAKLSPKSYRSLALQQQGGIRLSQGKVADAVKLFDQAADAAPNPVIGDVARLKSAFALLDSAPYKDMEARLTPLTQDGRPYRVEAREALAFAKLMAGDLAGARSDFAVLRLMTEASSGMKARAEAAQSLIDSGSAKVVPAAVKAALALPPPVQLPPGAQIPGLAAPVAPQQPGSASQ
ncbi:MAG: tetratricopeptide repeat protein [Phenylobacterium sp.]|uniref:tetratricopeptide repeat protein n=1 Tax=Phenylobacterium sp. TaxID=1871053 RepID=UPI002733CF6C|nr:tetratricopeptide repeat protein [Phenylobacterium sp.]MDP3176199.1 tetratricopeptide repeat protein [Phenylobacterium sp.]